MWICCYRKSSTVLNYCQIRKDLVDFIADSTDEKIGKFSPGMHIPIKAINDFRKYKPDIGILFAWNHKKRNIRERERLHKNGGMWLSHVKD